MKDFKNSTELINKLLNNPPGPCPKDTIENPPPCEISLDENILSFRKCDGEAEFLIYNQYGQIVYGENDEQIKLNEDQNINLRNLSYSNGRNRNSLPLGIYIISVKHNDNNGDTNKYTRQIKRQ